MISAHIRPLSHHTLREIKHNCRIPIKDGWLLPGIADESPTYEAEGETNVFTLQPGEIYGIVITTSHRHLILRLV
jgi:hypothetical protein